MQSDALPDALKFIDVQDSFVLGFERHGSQYWLRVLFALTPQHSDYSVPPSDEYASYRHGWVKAGGVRNVAADWKGRASFDPDGDVDFGTIDSLGLVDGVLICDGDWGQLRILCDIVGIELDPR